MTETLTPAVNTIPVDVTQEAQVEQPSLHQAVIEQYMVDRQAAGADKEISFLHGISKSDVPTLAVGAEATMHVTVPYARRKLLRTADQLGIKDRQGLAELRLGTFACSAGQVVLSTIGEGSLATKTARWSNEAGGDPDVSEVALAADPIIRELIVAMGSAKQMFMSEQAVSFRDDPEFFSSLIASTIAAGSYKSVYHAIDNHELVETVYNRLPVMLPGDAPDQSIPKPGVYYDENNQVSRIVLPSSADTGYHYVFEPANPAQTSLTDGEYHVGFMVDSSSYLAESSYTHSNEAVPFALTKDASVICDTLDALGLAGSQKLKDIISGSVNKRYGHSYAHLTNELCGIVNGDNRSLLNLFEAASVDEVQSKLSAIEIAEDTPLGARLVLDMFKSIAKRTQDSALPVASKAATTELYGLCKDVESYYAGAALSNSLRNVQVDNVRLLEKANGFGQHTFMLQADTVFNGVTLPSGTVMVQLSDGWAAGRVSAYAFAGKSSQPLAEAQRVFGAQMEEMLGSDSAYRTQHTGEFNHVADMLTSV